jgi:hypothetical protein
VPPVKPRWPDDNQDGVARDNCLGYRGAELFAWRNGGDVTENLVLAELRGQLLVEPSNGVRRLCPSVADEDSRGTGVISLTCLWAGLTLSRW